jgi:hypothetical protein
MDLLLEIFRTALNYFLYFSHRPHMAGMRNNLYSSLLCSVFNFSGAYKEE